MPIEPGRIYLAPSSGRLNLFDSRLIVLPANPKVHLPIDSFFRSLAIERKEDAAGIVLSGAGSDGTMGIQAIKGKSGLVIAQDPASAKSDGMPSSAIATGVVDFVLSPDAMPGNCRNSPLRRLSQFLRRRTTYRKLPKYFRRFSCCCVIVHGTTFRNTKSAQCDGVLNAACRCIRSFGQKNYLRILQQILHEQDLHFSRTADRRDEILSRSGRV